MGDQDSIIYPDTENRSKCVFNNFGGKGHPYSYCIKTVDQMVPDQTTDNEWGMELMGRYTGGIFNYGNGLLCSPELSVSDTCKGLLGNRYVLETMQTCQEVDSLGFLTGKEKTLSKYINNISDGANILTGGNPSTCKGVIPSTLGSVGKINALGVLGAFIGPPKPYCKEVNVKCHIVDDKDSTRNFTGHSGTNIFMDVCDIYNNMKDEDFKTDSKPDQTLNIEGIDGGIRELCGGFLSQAGITPFTNMNQDQQSSKTKSCFMDFEVEKLIFFIRKVGS